MPMNLSKIATATATLEVGFAGETAKIVFDPNVITQKNLAGSNQTETAFLEFFCTLVKSWDVQRGVGKGAKKVPLTVAGIADVPLPFLRAVFNACLVDGGGDAEGEAGSNSSAG